MKNFIIALLATLFVMLTTQVAKPKEIRNEPAQKKASIIQPLEAHVYAQKQEAVQIHINTPKVSPAAPKQPQGDDKAFIYMHESGNNPGSINRSSGACGLGQALPCSKMGCSLSDYACQDAWFTNYMLSRYGSWAKARAFWEQHRWW